MTMRQAKQTLPANRARAAIGLVFVVALIREATAQPVPPVPSNVDDMLVCQDVNRSPGVVPHVSPEIAAKLRLKELKQIRDARLRCDE